MKRFIASLFAALLASQAWAYDFSAVSNGQTLYYNITSNTDPYTVAVTNPTFEYSGYEKPTGDLIIPETVSYNGIIYTVTSISNYAFYGCSDLTTVSVPSTLTYIGGYVLENSNLQYYEYGNAYYLGNSENNYVWLVKTNSEATSYEIAPTCRIIGEGAFYGRDLTSLTIPNSVVYIGSYAFDYCSVPSDIIPNSVTSIGFRAFYACNFTSIEIPASVTNIEDEVFLDCNSLQTITVSNDNEYFSSSNGVLFDKTGTTLVCCPNGKAGEYTIPEGVEIIGRSAFRCCGQLTNIEIPETVTKIDIGALDQTGLTKIVIPNSVTSLSQFWYCTSLEDVTIPSSVKVFGGFSNCPIKTLNYNSDAVSSKLAGLTSLEKVVIGDAVTAIPENAFSGCTNLNDVTIGNSVKTIGDNAFKGCNEIESITIPSSVTYIGNDAFNGVHNIVNHSNVTSTDNWGAGTCQNDPDFVLSDDGKTLIKYNGEGGDVVIPDGVEAIADNAFKGCNTITSVHIPNSVESIGESAFHACRSLTSVTIPNSVTSIGEAAFAYCSGLISVTIPNSVTSIGYETFFYCTNLSSVIIPEGVTSIGEQAFDYCTKLSSVTIPNSVTSIGDDAFFHCTNLSSVQIPNSVETIGNGAFEGCSNLSDITKDGIKYHVLNDNEVEVVAKLNDAGKNSYSGEIEIPATLSLGDITYTVTSIADNAFAYCTSLESIVIPNSVTSIGSYAFLDCDNLTSISFPEGLETIGKEAFRFCNGLTEVTIPNSVTSIGEWAFIDCSGLTEVTIPNSVTNIGDWAFVECRKLTNINVASGNTKYTDENGVLYNKDKTTIICYPAGKTETTYTIPESVKIIGEKAFASCIGLTEVIIPNSVTSICNQAFQECNLTKVTIPNSVTSIGVGAFGQCFELAEAAIGNSVTSIGEGAFDNCSKLASITIPNHVATIGDNAFEEVNNIVNFSDATDNNNDHWGAKSYTDGKDFIFADPETMTILTGYKGSGGDVYIPNTVIDICDNAFYNCAGLTSVTIGKSVESVGTSAFQNTGLESVVIPESVTSICRYAFNNCDGLTSVIIPESVKTVGEYAFAYCDNLSEVTYNPATTTISENAFMGTKVNLQQGNEEEECLTYEVRNGAAVVTGYKNNIPENLTIPSTVTIDGVEYAVKGIGENAFQNCYAITSISIPESITSVGKYAFQYCNNLTTINISSNADFYLSALRFSKNGNTYLVLDKNTVQIQYKLKDEQPPQTVTAGNTFTVKDYYEGWTPSGSVYINPTTNIATIMTAWDGDPWSSQFNPPTWNAPAGYAYEPFEISFDARYVGEGNNGDKKGNITFIQGRGVGGYSGDLKELCRQLGIEEVDAAWEIQNEVEQMYVDDYTGAPDEFREGKLARNVNFYPTSEWQHFSFSGHLGRHAKDSVDIEMEFGRIAGEYELKNFVFKVQGKMFASYFNEITDDNFIYEQLSDNTLVVTGYKNNVATSATIPQTLTKEGKKYSVVAIGENAFRGCYNLQSITIPESITSVGKYAFKDCNNLTAINISSNADFYLSALQFSKYGGNYLVLDKNTVQIQYNLNDEQPPQTVTAGNTFTVKDYYEGWTPSGSDVYINPTTNIATIMTAWDGDPWSSAFDPPTWYAPSEGNNEPFEISFDARYIGNGTDGDNTGHMTFCQGRQYIYSASQDELNALCQQLGVKEVDAAWKIQGLVDELIISDYTGKADDPHPYQINWDFDTGDRLCHNVNFYPTSEWQHFSFSGTLGRHAAELVRLMWDVGSVAGVYEMKNVVFKANNRVFASYFNEFADDNFIYEQLSDNTLVVTGYKNNVATSATIPQTLTKDGKKYSVVAIGDNAFRGCYNLQSITIPESITSVGKYAFYECYNLSSITMSEGIERIGDGAFRECGLTTISFPKTLESIGRYAFDNCTHLTSVDIPNSVTEIGDWAFNNTGLKSITIPNSVTEIKESTFRECSALTSVSIPESVTAVGNYAFDGCTSLSKLTIPSSVTTIGNNAFFGVETVIYSGNAEGSPWGATEVKKSADEIEEFEFADAEHTHLIKYNGEGGNVVIPDGVITIGQYAFQNCSAMTSISIPESVTTIENYAFQGCSGLQKVEFASIESLCAISYKDNPYYYYGSPLLMANHLYIKGIEDEITEFTIPESVTTINDYVFYGSQITTLIVPEGIEVGENAFYGIEGYVYPVGITSYPTHGYTIDQSQLEGWTYQNWREPYVSYDDCIIISKPGTISTWDCQFNPPAWINPGKKDDEFEISFDARFIGYGKGDITFIQGRQFVYYNDEEVPDLCVELGIDEALTSSWQLQMYVEQLIVEEFTGQTDEFEPSKPFRNVHLRPTSEWQTFTIRGHLGRNGQDSVDLSFEFGSISGEYDIRNFTFKVNDKVFASYFSNSEPEPLEQLQANDSRLEGWKPVNATPFYDENVILRNEYFGDPWHSSFDPPTWYAPSKTGDEEFEIIFEAKYEGNGTDGDETGHITFCQGRQFGGYYGDEVLALCEQLGIEYVEWGWQLQYAVEQMIVDEFTGQPEDFKSGKLLRNVNFYPTSKWQTFSMKGHLGRHAKDSVDLSFEFGDIAGDYSIRNFVLIVGDKVVKDYFCSDEFLSDINKQLVKGLKYDFSAEDKTAWVIGYNGTETSVDIPATVEVDGETYRVTVIDNEAFKDNTSLAKVTIAKGIETIGAWAFSGCTGLSKVIVPSSVISIGKDAFAGVPAVNYADDKDFLYADYAHTQLVKYTGSEANITIPSTVVSIGENAFEDNTDLKSVQIPASVKEIGEGAFSGCTGIDNVNLPKTVESIGRNAFKGVKNLTYSGTADVSQCGAKNVIATTVEGDFVFADASKTKLIQYNGTGGNVEIPSTVESIGVQAFKGSESLTTLVIPNSVKTIEEGAFANCHNLTDVSGGDNLKTIAELAFRGCHHLKNITLPNSVETIGDDAFLYVKNVEYYGIADGEPWGALTVNGYPSGDYIYADREQTRLTAYVGNSKRAFIPEGVIYIGPMAFFESRNLSVVEIPSTVRNIGGMAFANCTNLTKANVPQSVSILGRSVFRDCPYVEIDIEFDSAPYSWSNKWDYTLEEKQIRWGNVAAPQPTPVAVSESAADLQVYAHGNTIVVENAADAIYVYDAMGRLICRDAINRVRAELQVNVAGIYIVKVGTTAKRVMVND